MYFCKQFLGVNIKKKIPNVATRNELSSLAIKLAVETSIMSFQKNNIAKK